jgi:arsenate reductase
MSEKIIIFHNPQCSKSRESLEILQNSSCEFEVVEYLKQPLKKSQLKKVIKLLRIRSQDLIRKSEEIYKSEFKGKDLTESEWLEAMIKFPKLIERPILIKGKKAIIGRPPSLVLELL